MTIPTNPGFVVGRFHSSFKPQLGEPAASITAACSAFRKKTNHALRIPIRRLSLTWLSRTTAGKALKSWGSLQTSFSPHLPHILPHILLTQLSTMIRSSAGSLFLALLAALSASSVLAAPQGGFHASHSPYKDYDSGRSHKRQDLDVPDGIDSCALPAGEPPTSGDRELVLEDIPYSQICLDQLGLTLVPEERAVCRTVCPTCTTARGYDMPCVAERVVHRSTQVDLTQLRDTKQLVSATSKWHRFTLTYFPQAKSYGSICRYRLRRSPRRGPAHPR